MRLVVSPGCKQALPSEKAHHISVNLDNVLEKSSPISSQPTQQLKSDNGLTGDKSSLFFKPAIQTKLTVNQPNDEYEKEADKVADKVMRMKDAEANRDFFFKPAFPSLQRKCAHCEEEENKLRRKETKSEGAVTASTENYINSLSRGRHLSESERSFFEPRMGYDFSNVRLHNDASANASAKSINALAYTRGNNIVFGPGQYKPEKDEGKKLLAHELTHVVQQVNSQKNIQRNCGREVTANLSGCNQNSMPVPERPRYLFNVSCDDFREGNELDLMRDVESIQPGEQIEIHGLASEEGDLNFNLMLSCARALKARNTIESVLASRGVTANISVYSHGPQQGDAAINRSVALVRHIPATTQEEQPAAAPVCDGIFSDGHDETSDPDHDLDKAHHGGERSPDIIFYDYVGGESGALQDFTIGFFGGTAFESTSDDDRLFNHFVSGNGSRISFTPSMDMASIIGRSPTFITFAAGFEQAVNTYVVSHGTLCGFDGNAYVSTNRPGYFHSPLFAWAVMGGYSRMEARVQQRGSGASVRYKIFDHFGAGVSDAWSYLPGLSALYYLQHFHGTAGTAYTPFIWSVEIERTSP